MLKIASLKKMVSFLGLAARTRKNQLYFKKLEADFCRLRIENEILKRKI